MFFSKIGNLKYISHLDLMRVFVRALRRTELPIKFSEGFNPHPRFSILRALKLGIESESEEAIFELTETINEEDIKKILSKHLPEGIKINKLNYA